MKSSKRSSCFFPCIIFLCIMTTSTSSSGLSRSDFPHEFVFGAGSSAYQIEGAAAEDGRKPSVWDTYVHQGTGRQEGTGDIASDQYHKYKEDVKLMHQTGLDAYRFSISWSRLIPDGRGAVNPKGLEYYNNLINELLSYGIEAHVTLSHFDIPQSLEDEYGGSKSPKFIEDFTAYADVCFREFGDRVKHWVTFNEPNIPGDGFTCSSAFDMGCINNEYRKRETYLAAEVFMLSHAATYHIYKTKYQEEQRGKTGITHLAFWYEPLTDSAVDVEAAQNSLAFELGWFLDPLVHGEYPANLRNTVGYLLPNITPEFSKKMRGSFDFIGLNHYSGVYIHADSANKSLTSYLHSRDFTTVRDDESNVPGWGLPKLLEYLKQNYKNPISFIHESGYETAPDVPSNPASLNDSGRVEYLQENIRFLLPAIRNGSNIGGYFVWSFMDCFELFNGYGSRYGLYGVHFSDKGRRRYPRQSAHWYSNFLAKSGNTSSQQRSCQYVGKGIVKSLPEVGLPETQADVLGMAEM